MAWKATIAGGDQTHNIQTAQPVQITQLLNERATAQFRLKPGYTPNRFDPVVLYATDGVTPLFGGLITNRTIVGIQTKDRKEPYSTDVQCGDWFTYLDWAYLNLTYTAAVTLKQVLTDLVAALPASDGITLNPAQGSPTTALQGFAWTQMRASDAIRDLSQRTGWVALISPAKVLTMSAPGATAAPFTITDAAPHCQTIVWTDNPYVPANDAIAVCGPSGPLVTTQYWTVGAPSTWPVDIQCVVGGWNQGYVAENGTVNRTASAPGGGGYYIFDPSAGKGTLSLGTGVKPAAGTVLSFAYTAVFPFTVHATTGATPVIQYQQTYPNIVDYSQGQEQAAGLLAQLNQQPRDLTVTSLDTGWAPGQALTVNLTARMNSAFVLTSVTLTLSARKGAVTAWVTSFLATESNTYQGSYLDQWRALTGTASAASGTVSTPPVGGGGGTGGTTGGIGGSGTPNKLPKWLTGATPALTDSIVTEVSGSLAVAGSLNVSAPNMPTAALSARYNANNYQTGFVIMNSNGPVYIGNNLVAATGSDIPRYDLTGPATQLRVDGGALLFSNALAGSAGTSVTLTPRFAVTAGGNVGMGTANPNIAGFAPSTTVVTIVGTAAGQSGVVELASFNSIFSDVTGLGNLNFYNGTSRVGRILAITSGTAGTSGGFDFYTANGGALNNSLRLLSNSATSFFLLPGAATYQGSLGAFLQKWATIYAAELHVETLVAQQTITTIGGRAVMASGANLLTADAPAAATTLSFKYNDFNNGDIIMFEGADQTGAYSTEFLQVLGGAGGSGPYLYNVTRNYQGATTAHPWPAGAACMNTGQTGSGFIDIYAINGLRGSSEQGPTIAGNIRNSMGYNDWSPRWLIGNITGSQYNISQYGAVFGMPNATRLSIDPINGILMYDGANRLRVQIAPNGSASFNGDGSGVTSINGGFIQTGTITSTQIAARTIVAGDIVAGTITTTEIALRTITAGNIAAGTITTTEIAAGTITANNIAAGTITAANIAAGSITADKLNVSALSAISANLGTVTAGSITGGTINGATVYGGNGSIRLDGSGLNFIGSGGAAQINMNGALIQHFSGGVNGLGESNWISVQGGFFNNSDMSAGGQLFCVGRLTAQSDFYLSGNIFAASMTAFVGGTSTPVYWNPSPNNGLLSRGSSSRRYKENILAWAPAPTASVLAAQPAVFNFKGGTTILGFIAEDFELIDPLLVIHDLDGRPDGIHHEALFAHIVVAVQDVARRLTALEGHA